MASAAGAAYSQSGSYQRCGSRASAACVYGKTGNVLGHEVLTYRPVDEAAQGLPGVDVGGAEGRGDVIECVCVGLAQLDCAR